MMMKTLFSRFLYSSDFMMRICLMMAICLIPAGLFVSHAALAADDQPVVEEAADGAKVKEYEYHVSKKHEGVGVFVSTQLLQMKSDFDKPDFIPLLLGVQNLKHRGLTVEMGRVHLYDRYGTEVPLATLQEVRGEYGRFRQDRKTLLATNFGGQLSRTNKIAPTNFFPLPDEVGVIRTQIPRNGMMADLLYFRGEVASGEKYNLVVDFKEKKIPEMSVQFAMP